MLQCMFFCFSCSLGSTYLVPWPSSLLRAGASDDVKLFKLYQFWRLAPTLLLNDGIWALLVSVYLSLRMGFFVEKRYGKLFTSCSVLILSFLGILLACILNRSRIITAGSYIPYILLGVEIFDFISAYSSLSSMDLINGIISAM